MTESPFDVNDAALRDAFLRDAVPAALAALTANAAPHWGQMTAQQMVEHLLWAFDLSNGVATVECAVPENVLPRMKRFLRNNQTTPREFMNPLLVSGLPPLRHASLNEAKAALGQELQRFLNRSGTGEVCMHPLFGPLDHEEWHRAHYKHIHHHLSQFGVIESEG
jgi:hypothetical protein